MQQAFELDLTPPKQKPKPDIVDFAYKQGCVKCGKKPVHLWMPKKTSYPRFTCEQHQPGLNETT